MFRGREVTHPERGTALLDKLASELSDIGVVEQSPVQDGRNMTMLLAPSKAVLATEKDAARPEKTADGRRPKAGKGEAADESAGDSAPEEVADDASDADGASDAEGATDGADESESVSRPRGAAA
jgi:translation initiation factor IF-3